MAFGTCSKTDHVISHEATSPGYGSSLVLLIHEYDPPGLAREQYQGDCSTPTYVFITDRGPRRAFAYFAIHSSNYEHGRDSSEMFMFPRFSYMASLSGNTFFLNHCLPRGNNPSDEMLPYATWLTYSRLPSTAASKHKCSPQLSIVGCRVVAGPWNWKIAATLAGY